MAKSIRFSVGRSGRNASSQDVVTIQYLLNCVPVSLGGPATELATSGLTDQATVAAISRFQQFSMLTPTGSVHPGDDTMARLHQFDPYPGIAVHNVADDKIKWEFVLANRGAPTAITESALGHLENAWPAKFKNAWPTKLALAPDLAEQVMRETEKVGRATPQSLPLTRPVIGKAPYDLP